MTVANGNMPTYPSNLKVGSKMALRYRIPLPASRPASRPYGFVPAQRPVQPVPYGFVSAQRECLAVEGGPFGSDRCV